jgi:hypothetical protein
VVTFTCFLNNHQLSTIAMTDYKATTDQWAYQEHWAQEDGDAACILELRARVEALEAKLPDGESDPEGEIIDYYSRLAAQHPGKAMFHQDSPRSALFTPTKAGFDGEKGIRLNLPNMPDGGFYQLRRGSTDPRRLDGDFKRQFVWVSPEGDESELWWCNEDNEWFLVSFERMAPL